MIYDVLEIVIPTYNRAEVLKKTLNTLLESPVKECLITILDNNSTDKTAEIVQTVQKEHSNIKYIKNHRNIGLAGNICKAMEGIKKKYFWIVSDNDEYDFSKWAEVEKDIEDDNDLIIITDIFDPINAENDQERMALDVLCCMFLPGFISKSSWLTDFIMSCCILDTSTMFPHMALIYEILNQNGKIKKCSSSISHWKVNTDYTGNHDRIESNRRPNCLKNGYLDVQINFLKSVNEIHQKKLREVFINSAFKIHYLQHDRILYLFMNNNISLSEFIYIIEEIPKQRKYELLKKYAKKLLKKRILHV